MGWLTDDLGDAHEGYLAMVLADGSDTGTHGHGIPPNVGHIPACSCDWRGTANYDHPGVDWLDEDLEEELLKEWSTHLDDVRQQEALKAQVQAVRSAGYQLVRAARAAMDSGIEWREIELAVPYPLSGALWRALEHAKPVTPFGTGMAS